MKKLAVFMLSYAFFLTSCSAGDIANQSSATEPVVSETTQAESIANTEYESILTSETNTEILEEGTEYTVTENIIQTNDIPEFSDLDDPDLLRYVEDSVYADLITQLNDDDYFVENVSAVYVSKEYLEELAYNSQSNIYFGYTLDELEEQFQGTKFVFDLGENGKTVVHEFEEYDDTYDKVIKNVAIGTGVILICVTVSAVSAGVGAPAVSVIFAASAKTGTMFALSSGTISGVTAGVINGIETKNFDQAIKAAALEGSNGFKWGAIGGSIAGGTGEAIKLYGAARNGLTMNEAAVIQKESKWSLKSMKNIHSTEEYNIYKEAGLKEMSIGGNKSLIQKINLDYVDEMGRTNAQRIMENLSPLDENGIAYELHHIGQSDGAPLAILSKSQHMQGGNNSILHWKDGATGVNHGTEWQKTVREFWKSYLEAAEGGLIT